MDIYVISKTVYNMILCISICVYWMCMCVGACVGHTATSGCNKKILFSLGHGVNSTFPFMAHVDPPFFLIIPRSATSPRERYKSWNHGTRGAFVHGGRLCAGCLRIVPTSCGQGKDHIRKG